MRSTTSDGCHLHYDDTGEGTPVLLVHPSGATASTWGPAAGDLAGRGRVIAYDRRGYARTGGKPVRSRVTHTADAASVLESLRCERAVVVGVSAGAMIAIDLAVRRPDLVRSVVAHEGPWRMTRHVPTGSQIATFAAMGAFVVRGRYGDAAEALLRAAYTYRDGGSAWDAFPAESRRVARENARATLVDFVASIGSYPSARDLATIEVPVLCTYGERSPGFMPRLVRSLAAAIPTATTHEVAGAAHAVAFDARSEFVEVIGSAMSS
jgi:pimeloyl-ACP methyl ester carboxylesterase